MPSFSHAEIAKKLVAVDYKVSTLVNEVTYQDVHLTLKKFKLTDAAQSVIKNRRLYNQNDLGEDVSVDESVPEVSGVRKRWYNWIGRKLSESVDARFQRHLQGRIDWLKQLKRNNLPDAGELEFTYIEESLKRIGDQIKSNVEYRINRAKFRLSGELSIASIFLVAGCVSVAFIGPVSLIFFVPAIIYGGFSAYSFKDILRDIPKAYANSLDEYMAEIKRFSESPETFNDLLEKHLSDAKELLPNLQLDIDSIAPSVHKRKKKHHSVARQSVFATHNDEADPDKDITHHHHHRKSVA